VPCAAYRAREAGCQRRLTEGIGRQIDRASPNRRYPALATICGILDEPGFNSVVEEAREQCDVLVDRSRIQPEPDLVLRAFLGRRFVVAVARCLFLETPLQAETTRATPVRPGVQAVRCLPARVRLLRDFGSLAELFDDCVSAVLHHDPLDVGLFVTGSDDEPSRDIPDGSIFLR
jgi:hypothetical protein